MIPIIILWLVRRYRRRQQAFRKLHLFFIPAIGFAFLEPATSTAQTRQLNYDIVRNDNVVGRLRFTENRSGDQLTLQMESDVKTRFVFTFRAHAHEEAVYQNGVLLYSSIYRQLNGNEKANKQHQADHLQYVVHNGTSVETIRNFPITYNMLCLYSREPGTIKQVYSDYFEKAVPIIRLSAHEYKVVLPDGNFNLYSYADGILQRVNIHHSLYSASIVLKK